MNHQPYTLAPLPRKVENFIKRRDQATQERINGAFEHILHSPFRHENPTTIKPLYGRKKDRYRYRIGDIRFIYRVDRDNRLIRILQIDNRGDIYQSSRQDPML
ncbi:MAG: type II toxin-antitoxin system RelE/ParE family toxin [Candidatus Poribacteria bacterium]|nr:type II toxin-antitoxin system RelE/ParE family toxin [Candidatus Poribacteria bacterium]